VSESSIIKRNEEMSIFILISVFLPADSHGDNDRLPPGVEHFSRGRYPPGDEHPDGRQGDEEGTNHRVGIIIEFWKKKWNTIKVS